MTLAELNTSEFRFDPKDPKFVDKLKSHKYFNLPKKLSYVHNGETHEFDYDYKMVFTYISLVYEIKSDLHQIIPSYPHRKSTAAQIAGYKLNRYEEFAPEVEAMLIGECEQLNEAIVYYTSLQRVADWQMYISFQNLLQSEHRLAASGRPDKTTIKNIKDLTEETERIAKKLFGGEEVRAMRDKLYELAENERLKLRSEDIAKSLEETGDLPDDFLQYDGYKPEKITFAGDSLPEDSEQDDIPIQKSRQVRRNKQR